MFWFGLLIKLLQQGKNRRDDITARFILSSPGNQHNQQRCFMHLAGLTAQTQGWSHLRGLLAPERVISCCMNPSAYQPSTLLILGFSKKASLTFHYFLVWRLLDPLVKHYLMESRATRLCRCPGWFWAVPAQTSLGSAPRRLRGN